MKITYIKYLHATYKETTISLSVNIRVERSRDTNVHRDLIVALAARHTDCNLD
jgi:hypothetical protein